MPWFTKSITCSRSAVIFNCYFHEMTSCGTTVTTYSKPFIKPTFYMYLSLYKDLKCLVGLSGPPRPVVPQHRWPGRSDTEPTTPPKSCDGCGKKEFDNIMKPSR